MKTDLSLSHVRECLPAMVDVHAKAITARRAEAQSRLSLPSFVTDLLQEGDIAAKKGPVFATAIIAGTMAAKQTSSLIPLCHSLMLEQVVVDVVVSSPGTIVVTCTVLSCGKTGVEMEALLGASIAALTIYDMCKALTKDIIITETRLLKKTGGKHDIGDKP